MAVEGVRSGCPQWQRSCQDRIQGAGGQRNPKWVQEGGSLFGPHGRQVHRW